MGRSITPKYRVETVCVGSMNTPCAWRPEYGQPTEANLAEYVRRTNESVKPGGCNEHIGRAFGVERSMVIKATIIRQSDNTVMASYKDIQGWKTYLNACYNG